MTVLLRIAEMRAADEAAMAAGIPSLVLMEAAGWQVARAIRQRFRPRRVLVLCGPGNNGGDGFVTARLLANRGWPVQAALLGSRDRLTGDAAVMAGRWTGPVAPLSLALLDGAPLIVDALFGAGLSRPLSGIAAEIISDIARRKLDVVAVDVPSGVDGDSGQILGTAAPARLTVTFFRPKPGHLLLPGRILAGDLVVADIGIPESVLGPIAPKTAINEPDLWRDLFPRPTISGHKYDRGHLLVACGPMTGAARLAALAGRRAGAGLLSIAAPDSVLDSLRAGEPGNILVRRDDWERLLDDRRRNACVIGPGLGVGEETRWMTLTALRAGKACVLDAGALTSFSGEADSLWQTGGTAVLTPHDGEYARLFAHDGNRLSRALKAACESGMVVLLKGPDTVVASPDGRASISTGAPPDLASGGTGDVLAGIIGGLLAQGMPAFEAASAAVWMQGRAATLIGPGLLAEDVADHLPVVLAELFPTGKEAAP